MVASYPGFLVCFLMTSKYWALVNNFLLEGFIINGIFLVDLLLKGRG